MSKKRELILTICTSYHVFLHKELRFGVTMIAAVLKFLVALIFGRPFLKRFGVCYQTVVCPVLSCLCVCVSVCLSVSLSCL